MKDCAKNDCIDSCDNQQSFALINFTAKENKTVKRNSPVDVSFFIGNFPSDVVSEINHKVCVDNLLVGAIRLEKDGNYYLCFPTDTVIQEGACIVIKFENEKVCNNEVITPLIVEHSYNYNAKRVDSCE